VGLAQLAGQRLELSGDGGADAETAFRVGRVSYNYMLFDASSTQVFGGGNG
jgi:hypothetical protein